MTGTAGVLMWLMMALTTVGMAGGVIAWARRRLADRPPRSHSRTPAQTVCAPIAPPIVTRLSESITRSDDMARSRGQQVAGPG
jgi:hypothetical protein